jgi:hypothetical protein
MEINNDSLARLAHARGITDVDTDEQDAVLAQLAQEQLEEEDRQTLKEFSENEDYDYGYHDQYDL